MKIEWNRVTWYSKLAAAVVFLATFLVAFNLGVLYEKTGVETALTQAPAPGQACTQETKLCPDGSSVGRTGPNCTFAECPGIDQTYTITAADSGKAYSYPITSRFTVELDAAAYPKTELSCTPSGVIGSISNIPAVAPPLYAARFEALAPGTCTLTDRDFLVRISVTSGSGGGSIAPYHSGVQGTVSLGPTCPVERTPPDPTCAPKPYATAVIVYRSGSQSAFLMGNSDANGLFKFSLPPGSYTLEATSGKTFPRCAPVKITVPASGYASTTISCDTGIR